MLHNIQALSGFFVEQLTGLATNLFLLIMNFLVMLFTLFFFFKDGDRLYRNLYEVVPLDETHKKKIFTRLDVTLAGRREGRDHYGYGAGASGRTRLCGVGRTVSRRLNGADRVAGSASIRRHGHHLAAGRDISVLGRPVWKAIAMLAWGAGVITMVDNFLRPMLIGKDAQLPILFLFFSIIGGLAAYGMIGLFFGPILLAILMTAIQIYRGGVFEEGR